jgi:hypothetical protein
MWLVLGESVNKGWTASADGRDLGRSRLVDGFANGWLVTPRSGSFTVTLRWTPQRGVWIALAVSAAAFALCLWLVLRRRGARRAHTPEGDDAPDPAAAASVELGSPASARPSPADIAVAVVGVGLVGALLARPWVGIVAGAAVLLVLLQPRARVALRLGAPVVLAACAAYVVYRQHRDRGISALDWPSRFHRIDSLAWLAVVLLLAEVVAQVVERGAASEPDQAGEPRGVA